MMFGQTVWPAVIGAICLVAVAPQETPTPASFLTPRDFNYHPYQLRQYLEQSKPTKQGPVLFPNDGPPPPRRPLIVTARPLIEAIANSDLNPNPPNNSLSQNSIATQNDIPLNPVYPLQSPTEVTLTPDLLANYSPLSNNELFGNPRETSINNVPEASSYNHVPYAEMLLKARLKGYVRENGFNDYEERTVLPPIYKALSDHASQNVLKPKPRNQYNYQRQNLDYGNQYDSNGVADDNNDNNNDYDQDQNYAFSYRVNDQKTGDDFSHKQQSVSGGTNGEYRVRLPDGRTQIVSYTADETGYKADVRYDDENDNVKNYKNVNINNDNTEIKQYNNENLNNVKQDNNNLIGQYANTRYDSNRNRDFNNIRQYDDQNIENNYFYPQNDNIKEYEDRIAYNNYVKHDNNIKQYDSLNLRNDYVNYKDVIPIKEDPNQYNSKEYYDYSSEYNQNYEPYNNKFAIFKPISSPTPIVTTGRPTYQIKPTFAIVPTNGVTYADGVISATNNPIVKYESTTENVVLIGNKKVYTNVNHIAPTEETSTVKNFAAVTPASYLASTIASLRDRITAKPVVLGNFINRINKYLSYN